MLYTEYMSIECNTWISIVEQRCAWSANSHGNGNSFRAAQRNANNDMGNGNGILYVCKKSPICIHTKCDTDMFLYSNTQ